MSHWLKHPAFWPAILVATVCAIYLPGLGAELIFDDQRLMDGSVFGRYGALLPLQERLVSYGSFVWVNVLLGDGWWKQRLVNLMLHAAVGLALYFWVRSMLEFVTASGAVKPMTATGGDVAVAAGFGTLLFVANPMAVYGVAYLIQRSIVMAALFSVLCLYATQRAAVHRKPLWLIGALAAYALALASKEHAVMLPVVAAVLYLLVRQPGKVLTIASVAGMLLAAVVGVLLLIQRYESSILGRVFDDYSVAYVQQLAALKPGIETSVFPLSIVNQAWLYSGYLALWFLPNIQWMALDLRPAFPLSLGSLPHVLGVPVYLGLLAGSVIAMVRFSDWRRWAGFVVFSPAVLFATEFATVWIQDPFVLYRSYLWAAICLPLGVALLLLRHCSRGSILVGVVVAVVFGGLSFERARSIKTEQAAWADAAKKVESKVSANAVGRWRPLLNRGNQMVQRGMLEAAMDDYILAKRFGDPTGLADYHRGALLMQSGKLDDALRAFVAAERDVARNPFSHQLYLQKGVLLSRMGRHPEAVAAIDLALPKLEAVDEKDLALKTRAQSLIRLGKNSEAIEDYRKLVALDPANRSSKIQLALAQNRGGQMAEAMNSLDTMLGERDGADIRLARAVVFSEAGRKADALAEARLALQFKPGDAAIQAMVRRLEGGS